MAGEQVNLAYHRWFAYDFDLGYGRTLFDLLVRETAIRAFADREVSPITTTAAMAGSSRPANSIGASGRLFWKNGESS